MEYEVKMFARLIGQGKEGLFWLISNDFLVQRDKIRRNFYEPVAADYNIELDGAELEIKGILEITVSHGEKTHKIKGVTNGNAKTNANTVECIDSVRLPVDEITIFLIQIKELSRFAESPPEKAPAK